ncbi:hypothetical protein QBC41DRAFT_349448 [Cercophora samala]|uniref:Uncharacterized protein n=1 Tax=Cercophora samala TaxID=330535 RepID=A0AA40D7B6_9PEZI|nr:hypothetical protein QBC41DRAFT_349448 [Cercophora samala]
MATADILAPQATLDAFEQQASTFLRQAQPSAKIAYKEKINVTPEAGNVFSLDDKLFAKLQLYIAAAFIFPETPEQFRNKYPFGGFSLTKLQLQDYELMVQVLTSIHQHCATFQTHGINSMIELSHSIANFADEVVALVNELKNQLEIICDSRVYLSSDKSKQARKEARDILLMLKGSSETVHQKCAAILDATSVFKTQTAQDAIAVKDLLTKLDAAMPTSMVDEEVSKQMKDIRESLLLLIRQQEESATRFEGIVRSRGWMVVLDWVGAMWFTSPYTNETKQAFDELRKRTDDYNRKVAEGNRQRLKLFESADRIRGLWHTVHDVVSYIDDAQLCLANMMDGMAQMKTSAETLITNLENIEGRVMPEAHASGVVVKLSMDRAVKAWNMVLQVAREFAKHGLIVPVDDMPLPQDDKGPKLFAAHYGGQDVTVLAKLIFPATNSLFIDAGNLPLCNSWSSTDKSLSLVYAFGNSVAAQIRVFVGQAQKGRVWTLTPGDVDKEGPEVTVAAAHESKMISGIKIYAVIYGLKQVTDYDVYQRLYEAAAKNQRVPISDDFFNDHDGSLATGKCAAIVYTVNGQWKSISGRQYANVDWSF